MITWNFDGVDMWFCFSGKSEATTDAKNFNNNPTPLMMRTPGQQQFRHRLLNYSRQLWCCPHGLPTPVTSALVEPTRSLNLGITAKTTPWDLRARGEDTYQASFVSL